MRKAHKEKDRQRKAELYVNNPEVRKKQQEKLRRHQAELYENNPEGTKGLFITRGIRTNLP